MMELTVRISDFAYSSALDNYLPQIIAAAQSSGSTNPLLRMAAASPDNAGKLIGKLLAAMSKRQKEQLAEKLINANAEKIAGKLNGLVSDKGIDVTIDDVKATSW